MEASMRILNPRTLNLNLNLNLNGQISAKLIPITNSLAFTLISQYSNSVSSNSFNNLNPIIRPSSFPISSQLGFFLSLSSSNSNHRSSHPNHSRIFNWHIAPTPFDGLPSAAGKTEVAAVILGWLGATPKHLRRYAELYTSRGMDAITFVVPVRDVLWFDLGRKVENRIRELADELVSWLSKTEQRCLVFHTFSNTGWLVYGAILAHLQDRLELIDRIKGCIVDSGGDPELNPKVWAAGFTAALLKKRNSVMSPLSKNIEPSTGGNNSNLRGEDPLEALVLAVLERMFSFLFKLPDVNQRLSKIISHLSENQPLCPQLYLYSTADKVIPFRSVESFIEHQKLKGRSVWSFNFESSPHVDHYRTFPDVYTSQVNGFLNNVLNRRM